MAVLDQITARLTRSPAIEVAWLYGLRATGRYTDSSDYDIALALLPGAKDPVRLVDDIQYQLSDGNCQAVSVVSINAIPVPLAQNIIA